MSNYIPTYKETKNRVVKMCLSCKHVEELTEATNDCPSCGLVGYLGFWDKLEKFKFYVEKYKPTDLNVVGEKLQHLTNEILRDVDRRYGCASSKVVDS